MRYEASDRCGYDFGSPPYSEALDKYVRHAWRCSREDAGGLALIYHHHLHGRVAQLPKPALTYTHAPVLSALWNRSSRHNTETGSVQNPRRECYERPAERRFLAETEFGGPNPCRFPPPRNSIHRSGLTSAQLSRHDATLAKRLPVCGESCSAVPSDGAGGPRHGSFSSLLPLAFGQLLTPRVAMSGRLL